MIKKKPKLDVKTLLQDFVWNDKRLLAWTGLR